MISPAQIGFVGTATDAQFIQLYHSRSQKTNLKPYNDFLQENNEARDQANLDAAELEKLQVTSEQIGLKLKSIIEKATDVCESALSYSGAALVEDEEINFRVTGLNSGINGQSWCQFCEHVVLQPRTIKITNMSTEEDIEIKELFIHLILQHGFFGRANTSRIDPTRICHILGLVKQVESKAVLEIAQRTSPPPSPPPTSCCTII